MSTIWSILICGIPNRLDSYMPALLKDLCEQAKPFPDVEVLCLFDNQRRSTGYKRNTLLEIARGDYISYIDDDDRVAPNYVSRIRQALDSRTDVVTFAMSCMNYEAGGGRTVARFSSCNRTMGFPMHTAVWRRPIAMAARFPHINMGEDQKWMDLIRAQGLVKTEVCLEDVLYFWEWRPKVSQSSSPPPEEG